MIPRGESDKFDKQFKQTGALVVAMIIFLMMIILAVVGTGIYIALHNWS